MDPRLFQIRAGRCPSIRARYPEPRLTIAGIPLAELVSPPWRRYVVESRLPRELVVRALSRSVQPSLWFGRSIPSEPFEGTVTPKGFKIRRAGRGRILTARRELLPLIIGRFESSPYGTRIAITVRPMLVFLGWWILWMAAVALIGILAAKKALSHQPRALAVEPVVLVMLTFGYLFESALFAIEAHKAKPMLEEILTAAAPSHPSSTP